MKRIPVILCLILLATAVLAAPPRTMNYQGTLTDATGLPVPDGNYTLTFRLWNASIGGTVVWSEAQSVAVDGGVFNVILGLVTPMNETFENQRWLGVQVGVDPELAPRTPLTSVPSAFNVVDGAAVTSLNGLADDVNIVAGPNISVSTSGQDIVIAGTGVVTDADWAVTGDDMTSVPTGNVGIGVAPEYKLDVGGPVRSGADGSYGEFRARVNGTMNESTFGGSIPDGSALYLMRSDNGFSLLSEPDIDGGGGYFSVFSQIFSTGFNVDGNYLGTNSPRVTISGLSSSMSFNASTTGDASVSLPTDAVAHNEILDEPGLASIKSNELSPYNMTTSATAITSRTIVCPADGYVYLSASYEIDIQLTTGTAAYGIVGLSDDPAMVPDNQDLTFFLPAGAASGFYLTPGGNTAVYPVTAGSHTFYLVGYKNSSAAEVLVWDVQLNALYVPTAYGTVTGPALATGAAAGEQRSDAPGLAGPSAADLAAERAQSERDAQNRVDAELAEMRAQIADLQRQLADMNKRDGG